MVSKGFALTNEFAGTGEPVVIPSGRPGLGPQYLMRVAELVRKQAKAVLWHQRGTGRSKVPVDTISQHTVNVNIGVEDLDALRRQMGVAKMTLLGHS